MKTAQRFSQERSGFRTHTCSSMMFITATTTDAPVVVGTDKQDVLSPSEIYSGCYVRASITFSAYNHKTGGKGIGSYLNGVQKLADGEPLGAARESADEMFGDDEEDPLA